MSAMTLNSYRLQMILTYFYMTWRAASPGLKKWKGLGGGSGGFAPSGVQGQNPLSGCQWDEAPLKPTIFL